MKRAVLIACWISVIVVGIFLRFDHLSTRPFHADEATGARITASRMESGGYRFDPVHFHGPLLSALAIPLCKMNGETRWQEMTKSTLRLVPAIAGSLLLLVPLLCRRRFGDVSMLAASALLASSPLLVYYSRMFIHESLLVLFGMLGLVSLIRFPRYGIPGLMIGLMFATKESFAISMLAWSGAGLLIVWEHRRKFDRTFYLSAWETYRMPIAVSLLAAAACAGFFYTDGFRNPHGAIDAINTFFFYQTGTGHDKPVTYYFQLLALPTKSGGLWWFGTPVVMLALLAFVASFRRNAESASIIRFLAYAAAGHFLIYSAVAYKTPWLACLLWAHVCLLAGFGVAGFSRHRLPMKTALGLLVGLCLISQFIQTRRATGRFASDERNPFAYVPTRNEIESLGPWLEKLQLAAPAISLEPVAVVGREYWPLNWYLRSFHEIGYWPAPPDDLASRALVFSMPDTAGAVTTLLADTHMSLPRGLRAGVPMQMFVRNDVWKLWMETGK
ncbi:MAG: flippase activity-associated protein Agl23 [Luteolibacter sp.]